MKTATTVDSGTQYTPPSFPPTDRRHINISNSSHVHTSIDTQMDNESMFVKQEEPSASAIRQISPPKKLGDDPQTHTTEDRPVNGQGTVLNGLNSAPQPGIDSPSKRARGPEMAKKVMPRDYMKCNVTDLGHVIAGMLQELVELNDKRELDTNALTRFHSRAPPAISIQAYLNRIIVHATPSQPILLSVVYWIDRLCARYSHFNISSLTVHRYLITATTVAAKGLSDSFWTNSTYSRVGGVSVKELFLLELEFLERMDWKIIPPADVLVQYYENLVARSKAYVLEEEYVEEQT
ncbi:hypothetical protein BLS_002817 [Venturia inaequalis]|uniref:Cyclin-domain-containing protein n=1 Tax=Venturia inaequalis TaxID=5025 RepID=A0A8H3VAP8_VENIN|nr:hypothetical protein BLS_002817 [Venturia inaequalis]RDI87805.1 hypothetical protein Vi05172_g2415 [Venturia inaequalis]